jgi:hypothetical protein
VQKNNNLFFFFFKNEKSGRRIFLPSLPAPDFAACSAFTFCSVAGFLFAGGRKERESEEERKRRREEGKKFLSFLLLPLLSLSLSAFFSVRSFLFLLLCGSFPFTPFLPFYSGMGSPRRSVSRFSFFFETFFLAAAAFFAAALPSAIADFCATK